LSAFLSILGQKWAKKVAFCKVELPIAMFQGRFVGDNVRGVMIFPPRLRGFLNKKV